MISVWRRKESSLTWASQGSRATLGGPLLGVPPLLTKFYQDPNHGSVERAPG